jgi:KDO2-lipid IV(A) lauroyltransferase
MQLGRKIKGLIVRGIIHGVSFLQFTTAQKIGAFVGRLLAYMPNKLHRTIAINISLCFPEKSRTEQQILIETGKTAMEMSAFWTWNISRLFPLIKKVTGEDAIKQTLREGHGCILLGPHLGAWELVNLYLSPRYDMVTLYRPPRIMELDKIIRRARERLGTTMMPTTPAGVKTLYKALINKKVIGLLPDQDPGQGGGQFAPFFGIQTWTMSLISKLASKSDAPVFFVYAERLPIGEGFHIHFVPASQAIHDEDPWISLGAMNSGIEQCARAIPEQYQWSYKRFKTRPEGEDGFYLHQEDEHE